MNTIRLSFLICIIFFSLKSSAQEADYQNKSLSPRQRAESLVKQLSLDEKIGLMMHNSLEVPRLGIPAYNWWNEALHGVGRAGLATVFPQSMGMAATFDPEEIEEVFTIISDEARAKYNHYQTTGEKGVYKGLTFWTPNINIFRDPRWGRGQETYGEDPYLTAKMGVAVVNGLQGKAEDGTLKTLACAKHFAVHSGPEWSRHTYDAKDIVPEFLWGTYLPAFEELVNAGVWQVMCAYNRLDGDPCCGNNRLLTHILREIWDYDGIVVSDCWALNDFFLPGYHETHKDAVEASGAALMAGTDLECGPVFTNLKEALAKGLVTEEKINESVTRLLSARFALGELDPDVENQWDKLPYSVVDSEKHRRKALETARKSMTLLKNNGILPLNKDNASIVVMGPNAADTIMQWGNYNGVPSHTISILDGIRSKIDSVEYLRGCDHVVNQSYYSSVFNLLTNPDGKGMKGKYWNYIIPEDKGAEDVAENYTFPLKFDTGGATVFAPGVNLENFTAQYTATFIPTESGEYVLNVDSDGNSGYVVQINGEKVMVNFNETLLHKDFYIFEGIANQPYDITLYYTHTEGLAHLNFDIGKLLENVKEDVNGKETVIFVGGITPSYEGEELQVTLPGFKGGDRTSIELPDIQRQFLKKLKEEGKRIVFVNCSGSAMALAPEDSICDAILQAWYPGQAGGMAVADVLFGDYNPAGRLPVTFYKDDSQLPDFEDYSMMGRTYRYMDEKPLYPFGHGLSYSSFSYSNPCLQREASIDDKIPFKVTVTNTSDIDGDEVVQLYIKKQNEENPINKTLRGFKRINIPAHSSKEVEFLLDGNTFRSFDPSAEEMAVLPGDYLIYYGGSSDSQNSLPITLY